MPIRVCIDGPSDKEVTALKCLLDPYAVHFDSIDRCDVIITSRTLPRADRPLIRIASSEETRISSPEAHDTRVVNLPAEVVGHCSDTLEAVMNPRVSLAYKFATRLPFSYNATPPILRNALLRLRTSHADLASHLTNEIARKAVTRAFSVLGFPLRRRRPPKLLITHDVDTKKGLHRALSMKAIEDQLGLKSMWFLSSGDYSIPKKIARDLGCDSTIGSHDVSHDGRLVQIHNHERLVERLQRSRIALQAVFERQIERFRSPLLQFSRRILSALRYAGYKYDFSLPAWEPAYPVTMSGFGVETILPFEIDGILETPLTLFQDHQVLYVLGLSPHEAVKFWLKQANLILSRGGDSVLLIHPDYSFAEYLDDYRDLLTALQELYPTSSVEA